MARELTKRAYNRLLRAFTPEEAKTTVNKWIDANRKKYSSSLKKLYIDGEVYRYDKEGDGAVSNKLRLGIWRKLNTIIGKTMSKAAQKRARNREAMISDNLIEDYRRMASSKRLQNFYNTYIKATTAVGVSALRSHANYDEVTGIKSPGLKGLLKVHLIEAKLRESLDKHGAIKVQLDAQIKCKDEKGIEFNFPTRTRQYVIGSASELPQVLSKMVTELQIMF